jgi:uracil-DNA glycosylase
MIVAEPEMPKIARQRREPSTKPRPQGELDALRAEAENCRACPLWRNATQTVFGEGPDDAEIVFVGEQPGDKEDLAGKPFVGPAGQMFDRALKDAGIKRENAYVTNAVKHFKFVPRGKIRIHQKPVTPEIRACRQWYEAELAAIKPSLVVALGATAAQSVLGKITTIGKVRGQILDTAEDTRVLVTVHPSYLLRLPDQDAKQREYKRFVDDLKVAAAAVRKAQRAA